MVASVVSERGSKPKEIEFPKPDPLPKGGFPEERIVLCGISWESYLRFDKALGDERPGPRFYYLDGELEIMTTSKEHERIKKWVGSLLEIYFEEEEVATMAHGHATMRTELREAGAEPDESWSIGHEKEFADLVLEIALTSGGVNKLETYRRFKIPEVWIWRRDQLEIFVLAASGTYEQAQKSGLLSSLSISLLERCVAIRDWPEARKAFRAGLTKNGRIELK